MGRTIALKLGPADSMIEDWLAQQTETPSAILRRALLKLIASEREELEQDAAPTPTVDTDALRQYLETFRSDMLNDIAKMLESMPGQSPPVINMPPIQLPPVTINLPDGYVIPGNGNGHGHNGNSHADEPYVKAKRPTLHVQSEQQSEQVDDELTDADAIENAANNFLSMFG